MGSEIVGTDWIFVLLNTTTMIPCRDGENWSLYIGAILSDPAMSVPVVGKQYIGVSVLGA